MTVKRTALWQATAGAMTARAWWIGETGEVEVVVAQGDREVRERFSPLYVPRFGLDVADLARVQEIAETLAQRLERDA